MKFVLLWFLVYFAIAESRILPDALPQFCPRHHENYNECTTGVLRELGPHLLKGVREINFPPMVPFVIPLIIINRTINEELKFNAVFKDLRVWGFEGTILKSFKFNTKTLGGKLHILIPETHHVVDAKLSGRSAGMTFNHEGLGSGNFSQINFVFKFVLKPTESLGVTYYTFDKLETKSDIASGNLALTSPSPQMQAFNDLNTRLFNANPKPYLDAIMPVWEEAATTFFRMLLERTLLTIPAQELIPE